MYYKHSIILFFIVQLLLTSLVYSQTITSSGTIDAELFPDPAYNFVLPVSNDYQFRTPISFIYAGDINGDNLIDRISLHPNVGDERTQDLTDKVDKTVIYFGGSEGVNPSLLVYENLIPVGDLNNDGFDDAFAKKDSLYVFWSGGLEGYSQTSSTIDVESLSIYSSFTDINGDGIDDVIIKLNSDRYNLYMIEGGSAVDEISLKIIESPISLLSPVILRLFDMDNDGISEILLIRESKVDDTAFIYSLRDEEMSLRKEIDISIALPGPFLCCKNKPEKLNTQTINTHDNGFNELLIQAEDNPYFIYGYDEETENFIVLEQFEDASLFIDIDDDSLSDRVYLHENILRFQASDDNIIKEFHLQENDFPDFLSDQSIFSSINQTGFYSTVGYDQNSYINIYGENILYEYFSNPVDYFEEHFRIDIHIDNNSDIILNAFEKNVPQPIIGKELTSNIGDFNGDGVEDFLVLTRFNPALINNSYQEFRIYFGGNSWNSPDLILPIINPFRVYSVSSGDFNGDGFNDLLTNFYSTEDEIQFVPGSNEELGLHIFLGGISPDSIADYKIPFSEYYPELIGENNYQLGFYNNSSIGDVNNDGYEDFVFNAQAVEGFSEPNNPTFIFLGDESLENAEIVEIPLESYGAIELGDFNGDNLNDFALIDRNYIHEEISDSVAISKGIVYIFFGTSDESVNIEPDLILKKKYNPNEKVHDRFGHTFESLDFNGDGFNDLVILPIFFGEGNNLSEILYGDAEGIEAIDLFLGGGDADSIADHSFKIPRAPLLSSLASETGKKFLTGQSAEVTRVPDMNGDGTDELYFANGKFGFEPDLPNGVIFYGNKNIENIGGDYISVEAPNQSLELAVTNNSSFFSGRHSAIGHFVNSTDVQLIARQNDQANFLESPIYVYNLKGNAVHITKEDRTSKRIALHQNYPNPFNPTTTIGYQLKNSDFVKLEVFDMLGRKVSTLVNQKVNAGTHTVNFDASNLASGVYIYRLEIGDFLSTKKMLLIK